MKDKLEKSIIVLVLCLVIYIVMNCKVLELFESYPTIYFINLERSKNRWKKLLNQLDELKIKNYNRFNGIDSRTYQLNSMEKHIFRKTDFDISSGVTGCSLSHLYVWKTIIDKNIKECIICEDDVIFNKTFSKEWSNISKIKTNYDLIFLYNTKWKNRGNAIDNEIIPYNKVKWYGCGAVSYYINNRAASILYNIALTKGIHRAIDWFIYEQLHIIKIGVVKYRLVNHSDNQTTTIW
jgi:glycosyl transferase family 25